MRYIFTLLAALTIISCQTGAETTITHAEDYNEYLINEPIKTDSKYFKLWNSKIKPDSIQLMSFGIVAGEYNDFFQKTGDIYYLKRAEQALEKAVEIAAIGKAGYYRALARNYISQHRFKDALRLADAARSMGSRVTDSQRLLFDVHMELGNYKDAEKYLDSTKNMTDFGYLIRLAKWNDYKGDLDTTIRFMEKALAEAEQMKNTELKLWSFTNLADYYGHAGRVKDSYQYYLESLKLDPGNAYAKKGIAWIVFSYEKNPVEALRILDSVTENYRAPDFYLLKAEIAEFMGHDIESLSNLDMYFKVVQNPAYGDMYNVYNVGLYIDKTQQYKKAINLSKKEVDNRATPESYSLLAYSYLKNGETEKAHSIVKEHIEGKTFEPHILYRNAEIYKAAGEKDKVVLLKKELMGAIYELGPSMEDKIVRLE